MPGLKRSEVRGMEKPLHIVLLPLRVNQVDDFIGSLLRDVLKSSAADVLVAIADDCEIKAIWAVAGSAGAVLATEAKRVEAARQGGGEFVR